MPWVYLLELDGYRDAEVIQSDWEATTPGSESVKNDLGGVTASGRRAVIVSERHNPEFFRMQNLDYVFSINEHKEIPPNPSAPVELGQGIVVDPR